MSGEGKIAIITGAGSGVGRAVAHASLKDGYRVALVGRKVDTLQATAEGFPADRVLILPADVTDHQQVDALFDATVKAWGRVDVVFNNAGIGAPPVEWDELPIERWKAVVDTNLSGVFYGMRAAFRVMKAQRPGGGRIINNGSISAHAPRPDSVAYTATKHAVTGLTRAAALDGRAFGIAVGQIDIGNAATDMTAAMERGMRQADGSVRPEAVMDLRHAADAVVHMASLPTSANVLFMTLMATGMPFVGRG